MCTEGFLWDETFGVWEPTLAQCLAPRESHLDRQVLLLIVLVLIVWEGLPGT